MKKNNSKTKQGLILFLITASAVAGLITGILITIK